jgi:hypothetical protein
MLVVAQAWIAQSTPFLGEDGILFKEFVFLYVGIR